MNDVLVQAALSLTAFPFSIITKASAIMAVALLVLQCMRCASASMRHLVLASAFAILLALPLAEVLGPAVIVPIGRSEPVGNVVLPITALPADTTRITGATGAQTTAPDRPGAISPVALLLIAWAVGAALSLVPVALTPSGARRLRLAARRWPHGEALVRVIAADAPKMRRPVAVLVHDDVSAPLTCGVAQPAIVLPADAPRWTDAEIRRALVHELEHVRRADWPVQLATRIVSALYWFNPLVWIAWRRLCLEAERACDDSVLRVAEPVAYAQQLVMLAKRRAKPSPVPALSMAARSDLSERIAAVLDDSSVRGPLRRARASAVVITAAILLVIMASLRAAAQAPQPAQTQAANASTFEVVSIRENKAPVLDKDDSSIALMPGGRFVTTNWPLRELILRAFALQRQQLVDAPEWIEMVRYDISATSSGPLSPGSAQLAIQRMLADRFGLAVHTETRELPIFALTVARSDGRLGPKIQKSATDCEAIIKANMQVRGDGPRIEVPRLPDGRSACGFSQRFGRMIGGGTTMANFAQHLSSINSRIIHDRTGLHGGFDIELEFTPDPTIYPFGTPPPGAPLGPNAPSFFTALEEQLGLKLEPVRAPVDVLVIDRVERPKEN